MCCSCCRFINRLLIDDKKEPIRFTAKPKNPFAELNNVEKFVVSLTQEMYRSVVGSHSFLSLQFLTC